MLKPTPRGLAAVVCTMTVALLGTACGSDDDDSSGNASSQEGNAVVDEATANVEALANPEDFTVEPLSGPVPAGKVVAQVNCTIPQCSPGAMEEPLEALGWTLERFDYDLTKGAQDYLRAVDAAIDSSPDFLAINVFGSPDLITRQLERAKAEGIPVIGNGVEFVDGFVFMTGTPESFDATGAYLADMAIDDAGGPVNAGFVVDPTITAIVNAAVGAENRLAEVEGSSVDRIELSFAQPQAANVSTIMNYLTANPDTEYLMFPGTAFYVGLDQALRAAGLTDKVKLLLAFPFGQDIDSIQDGQWFGVLASESTFEWRQVDAMARLTIGDPIDDPAPVNEFRLLTAENATLELYNPPGYTEAFLEAWGV